MARNRQNSFFNLNALTIVCSIFFSAVWATPTEVSVAKRATCTPVSAGDAGTDDVPAIQAAFGSCGNGGIIVIPAGKEYAIRSPLSFAGCVNCDFQIEGTLKMSDDVDFWDGKSTVISINAIKGAKMHSVTGTGLVDGNGQPYWIGTILFMSVDVFEHAARNVAFAANSSYARPTLVSITGASTGITISNLRFKNPANVFHSVNGGSTNILYESLEMDATSTATAIAKNTDGFDVGASTFVTIKNTTVINQDDCVALKPGSNFAFVTDITCNGSHGLSVGSLGGGSGSTDTVTNAFLGPATMINSAKAVGIKLWEGGSAHGVATVRNVTWSGITVQNCDYAIQIQSCYEAANTSNCISNTDSLTEVIFTGFTGTTSTKFSPVVANINCAPGATCDVVVENFSVKPPSGTAEVLCSNIDDALGLTCSGAASG
ncbi:Extracellular exo-polygalacturonase [Mycena sanguinolenta]|uniref:Extracellular exo-polygalacturonase n=1 Tax=Mycena sanguinolenta TaxID=230812 RepID=A0A8H6XXN2_9AGAR|nr:Extracellular exo-polygalacturonase [Mycena sanguinolenta]